MKQRIDFEKDAVGPLYYEFNARSKKLREGQRMFGSVRYRDLSVYTGPLLYKDGMPNKLGYGMQDLSKADFDVGCSGVDGTSYKYDKYVGLFDYRKTDWIYGNGVMYFTDLEGKPKGFLKAFFIHLCPAYEYKGSFDYSILEAGYTKDMELCFEDCRPNKQRMDVINEKCREMKHASVLMIGDSWFHFYEDVSDESIRGSFTEDAKGKKIINAGIGGTKYIDWVLFHFPELEKEFTFDSVLINLGINDIHLNMSIPCVMRNMKKLIGMIKMRCPGCDIYINRVARAPAFPRHAKRIEKLNRAVRAYCRFHKYGYIDSCADFYEKDGSFVSNIKELYGADLLHLSKKGSEVWKKHFLYLFK